MDEQAKFERLLGILLLFAGTRKYSLLEVAEKFELSERTIRRYIATFRKVGFIVECTDGKYHIPKLEKPFRTLSDLLHFSEEEAYILQKAIHSIDDTNLLKHNLIRKLYSLYETDRIVETVVKPGNVELVQSLITAIKEKKQILLRQYRSSHGNLVRDRLIEPFDFTTNYQFVWAFELESQQCKLFRTSRIGKAEVLNVDQKFMKYHLKEPMDVFRISSSRNIPVILRLNTRAYNLLIEEYPLAEQFVSQVDDNYWQFDAAVCGFEGIGRFCLGLPGEAEVLKPSELKDYLRQQYLLFN